MNIYPKNPKKNIFRFFILLLFYFSYISCCADDELPLDSSSSSCITVTDLISDKTKVLTSDQLSYLYTNYPTISKTDYEIVVVKMKDSSVQEKDFTKTKIYISEDCTKYLEDKAKLDLETAYIFIATEKLNVNLNNIPNYYFIIRHAGSSSDTKFINGNSYDFSSCSDDPIILLNSISIDKVKTYKYVSNETDYELNEIDLEKLLHAKSKGYDLFNINSNFFNDICTKYTSLNNTDVPLETRNKEYFQNVTFCDLTKGANYINFDYDEETKILSYQCAYGYFSSKTESDELLEEINSKMNLVFTSSNIKVITCYKELFEYKNFLNNYGEMLCLGVFVLQFIMFIIYIYVGIAPLEKAVNQFLTQPPELPTQPNNFNNNLNNNTENEIVKTKKKKKKKKKKIASSPPKKTKKKLKKKKNKENQDDIISVQSIENVENNMNNPNNIVIANGLEYNNYNYGTQSNEMIEIRQRRGSVIETKGRIDEELNALPFEDAKKYDKRNCCKYYCAIIQISHLVIYTFCHPGDYNLFIVKFGLFLFSFPLNLTINTLFYTTKEMQVVYLDKKNFISRIDVRALVRSLASSLISAFILLFLKLLCITQSSIQRLRMINNIQEAKQKSVCVLRCAKCRVCFYYILSLIFLIAFLLYVTIFFSIFPNTQMTLLMDMGLSWCLTFIYPFGLAIFTSIFRRCSLRFDKACCYKFNKILQMF